MRKIVLVTGSARGIGASCILKFASSGYDVVIHYLTSAKEAMALKKEVEEKYQVRAFCIQADLKSEFEMKEMLTKIEKEFGSISVLVNNAAFCLDTLYEEKTKENFMKTLEVNVIGTFLLSRLLGDKMYERKEGTIINITSTNGMDTYFPMCLDYDASKAALISLTHNLALQYAPYIRVNGVAPGWVATENEIAGLDAAYLETESEKIFLRRIGTPEEIANVVFFLASEEASYINNTIIRVDGGHYS
jgi:3-oxoacyl-[acyl-carrier protein] reductase